MQLLSLLQLSSAIIGFIKLAEKNNKPGSGVVKKQFVVGMAKALFGELAESAGEKGEFEEIEELLSLLIDIIVEWLF